MYVGNRCIIFRGSGYPPQCGPCGAPLAAIVCRFQSNNRPRSSWVIGTRTHVRRTAIRSPEAIFSTPMCCIEGSGAAGALLDFYSTRKTKRCPVGKIVSDQHPIRGCLCNAAYWFETPKAFNNRDNRTETVYIALALCVVLA